MWLFTSSLHYPVLSNIFIFLQSNKKTTVDALSQKLIKLLLNNKICLLWYLELFLQNAFHKQICQSF